MPLRRRHLQACCGGLPRGPASPRAHPRPQERTPAHKIADIYAHEGHLDRLLALVQRRQDFNFTVHYQAALATKYQPELVQIYEGHVLAYLPHCRDRKSYQQACTILKRIKTLGGTATLTRLKTHIATTYSNRPAFLDELRRV